MSNIEKRKLYKKIALALSLCAIVAWAFLGTGASLAWFTDTSDELRNIFQTADFELEVSHRVDGDWEKITTDTKVFDDEALYEPGYVQVVYLKIKNNGDLDFDFRTAVSVLDYSIATNYFGQHFHLQDYLEFGVKFGDEFVPLMDRLGTRESARELCTMKLSNYSTDEAFLAAGDEKYMALVVCMPEDVNNQANYRGDTVPRVELGIVVNAQQHKN